ncbi:MAG TPA: tetratricopeptide repeat protein [Bacteroidia bacterium]|jgi:serine phosphatase RsbU (regulator of sigma subunit)|nr:tetratricopeptide repeat protein [Bacteroidia bacterium]
MKVKYYTSVVDIMNKRNISALIFINLFLIAFFSSAQNPKEDSLLKLALKVTDNEKPALYNQLAALFRTNDPDKTIDYANKAVQFAVISDNKKEKGYALSSLGFAWMIKGNTDSATVVESQAISIGKELNDPKLLGACYNTLGLLNEKTGNIDKSTDNYLQALHYRELAKDTNGMAATLNNMGQSYRVASLYLKALESLQKAESLYLSTGNKNGLGSAYANIGGVYLETKKYSKAIHYFEKALKLRKETHNNRGLSIVLSNLAELYFTIEQHEKSIKFAHESIELSKTISDPELFVAGHMVLAKAFAKLNKLDSAEIAILPAIDSSRVHDIKLKLAGAEQVYSDILLKMGKPVEAYAHLTKALETKDSIFTNKASEKIAFLQTEIEKQKRESEVQLIEQKDKEQKIILSLGILMLLVMALFLFNRYRFKNRAAETLQKQNMIIEQKNKEIGDSINYAKRIQSALLPLVKDLERVFPEGFAIYKPKDVVSGDFYWFYEKKKKYFIAVADCTGHGVPGAFMSLLGADKLTHAVVDKNLDRPSEILSELNNGIKAILKQNESDSELRDGMDIALCSFEFTPQGATLEYAGANRPLYIIKKGELKEFSPTKASIGGLTTNNFTFANHTVQLEKGDTIYMFSDGFVDQFGGPKEKKFSSKRLKELLLSIDHMPMQEQEKELLRMYNEWITFSNKKFEQVDDVLLMGIRA